MKKKLVFILKYTVALLMVGWILFQLDGGELRAVFIRLHPLELLLAALFFNLGQAVGAFRMRYYYLHAGYELSYGFTLRLTYVSMFYNLLIPGGIGGDAYRVALLRKQLGVPIGLGVRLQLSNRVSGLMAISALILVLFIFSSVDVDGAILAIGITMSFITLTGGYVFFLLPLLKEDRNVALKAFFFSLPGQLLTLAGVAALTVGLGAQAGVWIDYLLLYLIAALAGMLPITIGGLGIREFTFFYGAYWMQHLGGNDLAPELGVAVSLACFGVTLISSLIGMLWVKSLHMSLKKRAA